MTRHFESSSLRKFASVFSFAACPSPRWYPHCGEGPGISEPSQFDQTADRLLVCVRDGNVGWQWVEEASLERHWSQKRQDHKGSERMSWNDMKSGFREYAKA